MKQVNCDLCGSNEKQAIYELGCKIKGENNVFHIVRCAGCGLIYASPQPQPDELKEVYSDEYYSYLDFKIDGRSIFSKIKCKLQKLVLDKCYGWERRKGKFFADFPPKILALLLKNKLGHAIPYKRDARILDVGCGSGAFLYWLGQMDGSLRLFGVELSKKAADYAGSKIKAEVICATLREAKFQNGFFDIVTMWDVLEHISNASETLRGISRVLKKGGRLLLTVPNFDSWGRKFFGKKWFALQVPEHLYFYSPQSLRKMLEKNGFNDVRVEFIGAGHILESWQALKRTEFDKGRMLAKARLLAIYPLCLIMEKFYNRGHIKASAVNKGEGC